MRSKYLIVKKKIRTCFKKNAGTCVKITRVKLKELPMAMTEAI